MWAMRALAPAILKMWGRKYLFAPAVICQVYQLCIAGLQESSLEEPKMHQNSWWPGLCRAPLGELTVLPKTLS